MKDFYERAVWGISQGFFVFPLAENSKVPPRGMKFKTLSTQNHSQCELWNRKNPRYNVGYYTGRFKLPNEEECALVVVDEDNKENKNGRDTLIGLELEGKSLTPTFSQATPSGGVHYAYRHSGVIRGGESVLGPGLDVRSSGGYIAGVGSEIQGRSYSFLGGSVSETPGWIISARNAVQAPEKVVSQDVEGVDQTQALARALAYLQDEAPESLEGQSGRKTTFAVSAYLKDLGLSLERAFELMAHTYNVQKCIPPWTVEDLRTQVECAYSRGTSEAGSLAPEKVFSEIPPETKAKNPVLKLNDEFAVVMMGGLKILWEKTDERGKKDIEFISESDLHGYTAARRMMVGDKPKAVSRVWMMSPLRRTYSGICFSPEKEVTNGYYNRWTGFTVPTAKDCNHDSVSSFLEHCRENVCGGDTSLTNWLLGYFAHLIQKPYEKPLTSLVFRGTKGVGKSALIDRVGYLLGESYLSVANRRYLTGNFNSHLENCLLLNLEEAFFSGEKQTNGVLKDLITGEFHVIERKGLDPYKSRNLTRVIIIGNEDWLAPASEDERRYAVFNVGEGRKQDKGFFRAMRIGMENGGYGHLLRYLQDFDLSTVDVDDAPQTAALHEQKELTLDPFDEWWLCCLRAGRLAGGDFEEKWPEGRVGKERLRDAYYHEFDKKGSWGHKLNATQIGKKLKRLAPSIKAGVKTTGVEIQLSAYEFPPLEWVRKDWDQHIGHQTNWEEE